MLFKKLFKLLVLGAAGCAASAQTPAKEKKPPAAHDAGTPADAGPAKAESGGGVQGW